MEQAAKDAQKAYIQGTDNDIRRIIDAMEFSVLEEPSDPEMEEWITLLPNQGNTRGRLTLYKRALHMY